MRDPNHDKDIKLIMRAMQRYNKLYPNAAEEIAKELEKDRRIRTKRKVNTGKRG